MDDFESKIKGKKNKLVNNVEGYFECQECGEDVFEAYSNPEGFLIWKCSEGHTSKIKGLFL